MDKALWKEVMNQKVYCCNRVTGCEWSDLLQHYEGHADTCQFHSKISEVEILNQKIRKLEEDIRKLQDENAEISQTYAYKRPSQNFSSSLLEEFNDKEIQLDRPLTEEEQIPENSSSVLPAAVVPDSKADITNCEASETDTLPPTVVHATLDIDESLELSISLLERSKQSKGEVNQQDKNMQDCAKAVGACRNMLFQSEENHFEKGKVDTNFGGKNTLLYQVDAGIPPPVRRYRWRIPDVAERISYARSHPNEPLDSPWWCTHHGGYRMQAYIYLNGNGRCAGTHMSVFVRVVLGPDDRLLRWPLTGVLTVILVDQEKNARPIACTLRSDPASSSFQRPTDSELNIACGCPEFASIDKLSDGRYVKDDIMFLEISFDPYERF
jgi:hypothetical protein